MKHATRISALCMAAAVLVSSFAAPTLAGDDQAAVQVSGTVKDSQGKPAAAVTVTLYKVADSSDDELGGTKTEEPGKRAGWQLPKPINLDKMGTKIGQETTDANGQYVFKSVKPGKYRYQAGIARKTGYSGGMLEVTAGKNVTFDITLSPAQK